MSSLPCPKSAQDLEIFEDFKDHLNGAISILLGRSSPETFPQEVPHEEFLTAMLNFVSMTLEKLLKICDGFYEKDKFFVFLPCEKLSSFFWKILEETHPLRLPIWNQLFLHPTMSFFQKSFLENQNKIINYL